MRRRGAPAARDERPVHDPGAERVANQVHATSPGDTRHESRQFAAAALGPRLHPLDLGHLVDAHPAGVDGQRDCLWCVCVRGDVGAAVLCFGDDDADLLGRVLHALQRIGGRGDAARHVDLEEVAPVAQQMTSGLSHCIRPIGDD